MQAAATKTLVLGIALFYWSYMRLQVGTGTGRTKYIMYGMMFGVVMWALLMFVVAPAQRKILSALEADKEAPASTVRRAAFVSKLNGLLVGPMLLLMVFANNYATFSYGMLGLILVIGVVAMGGTMAMSCVINRRQK